MAILITKLVCLHSWWLAVIWKKQHMTTVSHTRENTHTHTPTAEPHLFWKRTNPIWTSQNMKKKTLYESFYRPGKQRQPCTFEWCTWNNTHDFAHVDKANAIDISWRLRLRWIWLDLQGDFESSCDNLKDKATIWNPHLTLKPPHPLALACIQFHPESITKWRFKPLEWSYPLNCHLPKQSHVKNPSISKPPNCWSDGPERLVFRGLHDCAY